MATIRATIDNTKESFMDELLFWLRMKDYAVSKPEGKDNQYSWSEVIKHDKPEDCWIVVHGVVYDVTKWVPLHPGGKLIYDGAGGDCTAMWESYHPSHVLAQGIPDKYRVGTVLDFEDFYQWGGKFYDTIKKKVETTMPK